MRLKRWLFINGGTFIGYLLLWVLAWVLDLSVWSMRVAWDMWFAGAVMSFAYETCIIRIAADCHRVRAEDERV